MGGDLIYLIDDLSQLGRLWEIDFNPVRDDQGRANACLISIDHVAQTVAYEEMPTWLLFYTSIFETVKSPMVDIIDPAGVVRSQVVENSEGDLRITMNGAENRRTLAGHFIAEKFGSGIQHIAFRSGDIFATAKALRENGFQVLLISCLLYTSPSPRDS